MELGLVIDRLRDRVTELRVVAGAAAITAAQEDLKTTPAAYVIPLGEQAARNALVGGGHSQQVSVRFGVVLAARNVRDARGQAGHEELERLREAAKSALIGWAPDADHDPIELARGQLLALTDTILWWQDEYLTSYYERH